MTASPSSTKTVHSPDWWLVIPAAGSGSRMGVDRPKQYLTLDHRTMLEVTLSRFIGLPGLQGVVLALAADDRTSRDWLDDLPVPVVIVEGGAQRADTVLNALAHLRQHPDVAVDAWVMVHDAARPAVRADDILKLLDRAPSVGGGLLAAPVRDTLKRADVAGQVAATIDRTGAYHALTPQFFPLEALDDAMRQALADGVDVTDESSAMEAAGMRPLLVEGAADNIKVTHPADLPLIRLILQAQGVLRSEPVRGKT